MKLNPIERLMLSYRLLFRVLAVFLTIYLLGIPGVYADQVKGLYEAAVPVNSRGERERNEAAGTALAEVLVRVSGTTEVLGRKKIREALQDAQRFMHRFAYESSTEQSLPAVQDGILHQAVATIRLRAYFQPQLINDLLKRASAPIWPDNRPVLLVLLVLEDEQGRRLVTEHSEPAVAADLLRHMQRRGVPARFPNLDSAESLRINPEIVWNHEVAVLQQVLAETAAQWILNGRAFKTSDGLWIGDWTLVSHDTDRRLPEGIRDDEASLESFLAASIDQTAENLSALYSVLSRGTTIRDLLLQVSDVDSFAEYWHLTEYLQTLTSVQSVQVVKVAGTQLWLQVRTDVRTEDLQKEIALGSVLVAASTETVPLTSATGADGTPAGKVPVAETTLKYRWIE